MEVLGIDPGTSCLLDTGSTTELYPAPRHGIRRLELN